LISSITPKFWSTPSISSNPASPIFLCGCLPFAKADDLLNVTKRLNGGTVGLDQHRQWLAKWKAELGSTPIMLAPAGPRVILPTAPRPLPPDVPKPAAPAAPPSLTNPAKGSIGAFIASILAAIFKKKRLTPW
jgi:putative chitinase